ncbi:uncharacterized protein LOC126572744 [Anopheles aquasalis]|uniref:uncharacterized protein LOC126572744 n=1 Tax=Anopheles aquasalis TaxID=42839 RepID=UPI00215A2833|nr:uncharacterized protein LOC126572744 [Anopheles aquasalis]
MNVNNGAGKSTTASVYRLIQSPAPICMFYFAHPFGIASPASGAKLAQIRDRATKSKDTPPVKVEPERTGRKASTKKENQRRSKEQSTKAHRKQNGHDNGGKQPTNGTEPQSKQQHDQSRTTRHGRKHRKHRRISNFEKFLLEIQQQNQHTCGAGSTIRRIDQEDRITPLVPWPSIIWNRDFLIPPLLQALAQQRGCQIPDIEQILRTVRSAWNTPNTQRSHLQSLKGTHPLLREGS